MAVGEACDCQVLFGADSIYVKALNADGSPTVEDFYEFDCPVTVSMAGDIKDGEKFELECGDALKNVIQTADQIIGATIGLTVGCKNAELEFILGGSVGSVTYDLTSPTCAIGYCVPTLAEQAAAVPFELKVYEKEYEQSNIVGYCGWHFYMCLPTYVSDNANQKEYNTPEFEIAAVENTQYNGGKGVYCWKIVAAPGDAI